MALSTLKKFSYIIKVTLFELDKRKKREKKLSQRNVLI